MVEYSAMQLWDRVLDDLKGQMTLATYNSVFRGSQAGMFDGETLDVALVSRNAVEWANGRLMPVVERAMAAVGAPAAAVRFSSSGGNSPSLNPPLEGGEGSSAPEVSDRRRVRWYRIDNVVLDDYLPLMGVRAFAVYSLYCRMSGRDGLSWPGYSYVCSTLRIGRATLAKANKVLEVLGLIEIEQGNSKRSNRYYLLEPEQLTAEVIEQIRDRAVAARGMADLLLSLASLVGSSIQNHPSSVQNYPSSQPEPPQFSVGTRVVPTENYPSSPRELEQDRSNKTHEQDTGTREYGSCYAVPGQMVESDSDLADWLVELGVARDVALKLVLEHKQERIIPWVEYTLAQSNLRSPAAFLVAKLKEGSEVPVCEALRRKHADRP